MSRRRIDCRGALIGLAVGVAALLLTGRAEAAQTVHLKLTINGEWIQGESTISSLERADTIECSAFSYELFTPRDAATAALTGRRQHRPVKFTKRIDKSTPRMLQALVDNEPIESAEFRFYRPAAGGGAEEHFYTVLLEGGYIASVNQLSEDAIVGGPSAPPMMETVTFVFDTITWTYEVGGATATDTWGQ